MDQPTGVAVDVIEAEGLVEVLCGLRLQMDHVSEIELEPNSDNLGRLTLPDRVRLRARG